MLRKMPTDETSFKSDVVIRWRFSSVGERRAALFLVQHRRDLLAELLQLPLLLRAERP